MIRLVLLMATARLRRTESNATQGDEHCEGERIDMHIELNKMSGRAKSVRYPNTERWTRTKHEHKGASSEWHSPLLTP